MKKSLQKNEIDLIEVIQVILKEKFKVFIFILLSLIIACILEFTKTPEKKVIQAKSEITPISSYDEAEYNLYSSILSRIRPLDNINNTTYSDDFSQQNDLITKELITISYGNILESLKIYNIDKEFLQNLYLDQLNNKLNLIDLIKNYNFLNKEDYLNLDDYEKAVISLVDSLKITKNNNGYFISATIIDIKKHESFLTFLDKEINNQVQKNLSEMFTNNLNYINKLKKFKIEDIDLALNVTKGQDRIDQLIKQKNILISDRYIERITDILKDSPISNPNKFYAAKIKYTLTKYENENQKKRSFKSLLLLTGICGALVGLLFVLIANALRKRK